MSKSLPMLPSLVRGEEESRSPNTDPRQRAPSSMSDHDKDANTLTPAASSKAQAEDRLSKFYARQVNSALEVRLEMALFQRDALEKLRLSSASVKLQGLDAFKQLLQNRFGTITAAWRQLLDPSSHGKVSFSDFCQCCRDLGFQRKMKALWRELDTHRRGWITLDHLDPVSAQLLRDFRNSATMKHGGLLNAWYFFDVNKNHRVDLDEFIDRCKLMDFQGNARQLFNCLKRDVSHKHLSIQDFDEKAMQCLYRGDVNMTTTKTTKSMSDSQSMFFGGDSTPGGATPQSFGGATPQSTGLTMPRIDDGESTMQRSSASFFAAGGSTTRSLQSCSGSSFFGSPKSKKKMGSSCSSFRPVSNMNSRWTEQLSKDQIQEREEKRKKREEADVGMNSLSSLKRELVVRFGSIHSAWRQALDLDGNGRLSFGELCVALRHLGYGGNVKQLWVALDQDHDGFVMLYDLDPRTHEMLSSYRRLVLEKYPNMLAVWRESIDTKGCEQVEESTFVQHCKEVGWPGDARSLFLNLKEERSRKFMTLRDFDIKAWNANNRGDMEMISEDNRKVEPASLGFNERQEQSFSQRWARMNAKMHRTELDKVQAESKSLDLAAGNEDSLKELLVRRYGTITAGWKHGLDVHGNGRLPFGDFCNALRRLGFNGNMRRTFNALDKEGKGSIALKDVDREAHEILTEFRTLLLEKYGTYIKGFKAMDTNGTTTIEEPEMAAACRVIGYSKDPAQLFKYLLDGHGKRNITMADIDPLAMQAYWRGDLDAMKPMDKAKASLAARLRAEQELREKRMEASDWSTLKKNLVRKYGTITSAWRQGLDQNGNGRLSFVEFCKQVRNLGFSGNIQQVFRELDTDASGIITFNEVDSDWYSKISEFHKLLHANHRSYESAWRSIDTNRNNVVELDEFVQLCTELGYSEDAKALFKQLLVSQQFRQLAPADLESTGAIVGGNKDDANSTLQIHKRNEDMMSEAEKAKFHLHQRQAAETQMKAQRVGSSNWQDLKEQLIRKFGTITAAWRHGLDFAGNGKVSFMEFSRACRENGFHGNIDEAFRSIDVDESGVVSFEEIDHDWFVKLKLFRQLLLQKFGSDKAAFAAFDTNRNNMTEHAELDKVCKDIGYTEDTKALFKQLLAHQGVHFLSQGDFDMNNMLVSRAVASSEQVGSRGLLSRQTTSSGSPKRSPSAGSPLASPYR